MLNNPAETGVMPDLESEEMSVETSPSMFFEASSIFDAVERLEAQGVFEGGGVFLTDSDYTIRKSVREFVSGYPDRIDPEVQKLLLKINEKDDWDMAIITDQPDKGHQVATIVGKARGYTPLLQFAKENNIEVLGGYNDPVRFTFKERGQYKKHGRAIRETVEMLESKNYINKESIVWMGDTDEDVEFGVKLERTLRGSGYSGKFYLVKIESNGL